MRPLPPPPAWGVRQAGPGERVVIVGTGEQAAIAFEYLTHDSPHEVAAFSADPQFLSAGSYCGRPVVPLGDLAAACPPQDHRVLVAVSATRLNRVRRRLLDVVRAAGYQCISHVSSRAFVSPSAVIGENVFIFENCVLQPGSRVGDNALLWTGAFVAHSSVVGDNCCLSAQAAVAGFCRVGRGSFLGISSCVSDIVTIAEDCVVGAGAVVIRDTEPRQVYVGNPARPTGRDSFDTFGVTAADSLSGNT